MQIHQLEASICRYNWFEYFFLNLTQIDFCPAAENNNWNQDIKSRRHEIKH